MRDIIYIHDICINGFNLKKSVGIGKRIQDLPSYYIDFKDNEIKVRPDQKIYPDFSFFNLNYDNINFIEYSICSRLYNMGIMSHYYYLIDIIIFTIDLEIHLESTANQELTTLFNFLKTKNLIIKDTFNILSLSQDSISFKEKFDNYCINNIDTLAKQYHLDHPRKNRS